VSRSQPAEPTGKAAKIIDAARAAFFEQGYDAISMDEVARRAGVAKQTVYSYYSSKDALFLAVHERERKQFDTVLAAAPIASADAARAWLRESGLRVLELLLNPSFRALLRVTVAAADRFPSLGKSIYEGGIKQGQAQLADIFRQAAEAGALRVDDPEVAVEQYVALLRGELFLHCLFDPSFNPSRAAKLQQVEHAVDCFLARYGVAAPGVR
jgi:TetR/AcrR family transcriptional regulator, mexJK operon transcriptional repressor